MELRWRPSNGSQANAKLAALGKHSERNNGPGERSSGELDKPVRPPPIESAIYAQGKRLTSSVGLY